MKEKTILLANRVKLILAFPLLLTNIITVLACIIEGSYVIAFMFLLLGWITFDYIKICWAERKGGKWYEKENVEKN